jgi:beta-lactamase regulating signal transducer with metallopeptidase domain
MKRPSFVACVAGHPAAAIPLTLVGVWMILLWTNGHTSIWLPLVGFFVVIQTLSSAMHRRRYKAWRKEWESVGNFDKAPPVRQKRRSRWTTALAAVLFIGIIACLPQLTNHPQLQNALTWLWLLCGIFLIARLVIAIGRRIFKRRSRNVERAQQEVAPVSWMLGRTLDSPSREMAVRSLPEYAARILNRQN